MLPGEQSGSLVTLDVARWVASLLSNTLSFANNFISANARDPVDAQLPVIVRKGPNLRERESLLRRRVHQCFTALGFSSIPKQTQMVLRQSVVSLFPSPDGYTGSSVQAAIASSRARSLLYGRILTDTPVASHSTGLWIWVEWRIRDRR